MRLSALLLFLSLLTCFSCSKGQSERGCNDPFALNYDSTSSENTGCAYPTTSKTLLFISDLERDLKETSGLASINGNLITHNDKGGKNELYAFEKETGVITNTFIIAGATNIDWEELAQSDDQVFIGDFGNNDGDRRDLKIYIVNKADFDFSKSSQQINLSGVISFDYPEQKTFNKNKEHNFDCEAMVYYKEYLYLFMKHRKDRSSVLYRLPATSGMYNATKMSSFQAGVKVTGADISADGTKVLLVGYNKNGQCVLWELSEFEGDDFLSGRKQAFELGLFRVWGQIEAISLMDEGLVWLTSEAVNGLPPRLYQLKMR